MQQKAKKNHYQSKHPKKFVCVSNNRTNAVDRLLICKYTSSSRAPPQKKENTLSRSETLKHTGPLNVHLWEWYISNINYSKTYYFPAGQYTEKFDGKAGTWGGDRQHELYNNKGLEWFAVPCKLLNNFIIRKRSLFNVYWGGGVVEESSGGAKIWVQAIWGGGQNFSAAP